MLIADLIKSYAQQRTGNFEFYLVSPDESEIMLRKAATWNDIKFQRSRIVRNAENA